MELLSNVNILLRFQKWGRSESTRKATKRNSVDPVDNGKLKKITPFYKYCIPNGKIEKISC